MKSGHLLPEPAIARLCQGLAKLQLKLDGSASERLLTFLAELARWNRAYNLTAIRNPDEMVTKHVLDSLSLLPVLSVSRLPSPVSRRLLDVGSGAGLPAIPIAIAAPQLQVTALDSNSKKARFLRHVQRTLKLANLEVAETRVEAFSPDKKFDVIVSRAFASLADFFKLTGHLLAPGGQWVAMKGKLDPVELAGIPAGIEIRETRRLNVPGLAEERHAIIAVKQ